MNLYEIKVKETQVLVRLKCDVCKEEADINATDSWHDFDYMHHDWGNDSGDSRVSMDICSAECLVSAYKTALEDLKESKDTGEIDRMPYKLVENLVKLLRTV